MYTYNWRMAAVATTTIILVPDGYNEFNVLVGKRSDNSDAFPGAWAFPGGFLDVAQEKVIDTVVREVKEETDLNSVIGDWNLFHIDDLFREDDPRQDHVVNICYYGIFTDKIYNEVSAGDDLQDLKWVKLTDILNRNVKLAFTHNRVADHLPVKGLAWSR